MPVQERDYMKSGEPEKAPRVPAWLTRLNEFGERHARMIISVSTGLVILTVLLFAKYFYDRSMMERGEQELLQADTVDRLKELKEKYSGYPVAAKYVYRLANRYYEENQLEAARNEYLEFNARFPGHPLAPLVQRSLDSLERNVGFMEGKKDVLLKERVLRTHPRQLPDAADPRLQWSPLPEPNPVVEIETSGGIVRLELFEYEAPNAAASLVKLCDEKYFDGIKLEPLDGDARLATRPKAEKPADYLLPPEKTGRIPSEGAVVLIPREGGEYPGGEFQILLKDLPDLKDALVIGSVKDGLPILKNLKKDDEIKSAKVVTRRDHPYEPTVLRKP